MDKAPNVWKLRDLLNSIQSCSAEIDGKWIPARPIGFFSIGHRIRAALAVFTGKADALIWPGDQ